MLKSGLQNWTPFLSGSMKIPFRENFLTSAFKKLSTDYEKEQHQLQDERLPSGMKSRQRNAKAPMWKGFSPL